jgi:hypothetical protein
VKEDSSTGQSSAEDIVRADRIQQEKELLRRTQESGYRIEKIKFLLVVYAV